MKPDLLLFGSVLGPSGGMSRGTGSKGENGSCGGKQLYLGQNSMFHLSTSLQAFNRAEPLVEWD